MAKPCAVPPRDETSPAGANTPHLYTSGAISYTLFGLVDSSYVERRTRTCFLRARRPRKRNAAWDSRRPDRASGGSSAGPSVASAWIASRLAPHGGRPRQRDTSGQPCYPDGTAVASRRSQRPAGPSYPDGAETERARPRSRSPADFACSPRPRSVRCEPEIRTACILAKLAPGSRMPQDAPGAVGGHGCRRRR